MSDPQYPNYKKGVGRLVTDRFDFQNHVDGYSFRHKADAIDLSPTVTIDGYGVQNNVQEAIEVLAQIVNPPDIIVNDATIFQKGIIQLAGDLGGTATNVKVIRLQGFAVSTQTPTSNQVLTWNGVAWSPSTPIATFTAAGDLFGNNVSQTVVGIQGRAVSSGIPSNRQVLTWVSANNRWEPAGLTPSGTGFATVTSGVFDGSATANIRYTGGKFQTDQNIQWRNGAVTGDLVWAPTTVNKTITFPDITDTVVTRTNTETLTNKTINATNNTITDTSTAVGDLLVSNGTKFVRQAQGSNGSFLGVQGGVLGYYTPSSSTPTGTGFPTITSNVYDSTATTNIRYTDRLQTDLPVQWKNGTITGDLAWGPTSTNKILTLPDATDTLVGRATTDTLTNKAINISNNTLTATSQATGDLIKNNGSQFTRMARGSALQVLRVNSGGSDLEWATIASGGSSSGAAGTLQASDGSGGFSAATNVLAGSGFMSVGTAPATSGQIRLTGNTSTDLINYQFSGSTYAAVKVDSDNKLTFGSSTYSSGTRVIGNTSEIYASNGIFLTHGSQITTFSSAGIELGGPVGGTTAYSNAPFSFKAATININGGTTSYTAIQSEYICPILVITGTGDGRTLVLPNVPNAVYIIANTSSGTNFTVKVAGQTGVVIAQAATAIVRCNGSDYVRVTEDAA